MADEKTTEKTKLTDKQKLFVGFYLGASRWNGTDAARRAGYSGDDNVLGVTAYDNLRNPKIQQEISRRAAAVAMGADEVLIRLAEHGRGSQDSFWEESADGERWINLNSEKAKRDFHLLKKIKMKKRSFKERDPEDPEVLRDVTETETEIEMYDAQSALVHLGRHHKLFTDKMEASGENGQPFLTLIINGTNPTPEAGGGPSH